MSRSAGMPLARPEIVREPVSSGAFGIVEKPLSTWERITNVGAVRKFALLVVLAGLAVFFIRRKKTSPT